MDPNPQQSNPLAGLMSMFSQSPAATAAPQQQAPVPQGQAAVSPSGAPSMQPAPSPPMQSPGNAMSPMVSQMMGQAQQTMQNPMGQAVPQGGGVLDALKHPMVAGIVKALANAAQSYGWTAMMPQEREERTQMNQQKAESLARLAETGAYQGGSLDIRQQGVAVNQQKADTLQQRADTFQSMAETQKQKADAYDRATDARIAYDNTKLQVTKSLGQGRIDEAYAALSERADDFTRKLDQDKDIAKQNIGVKQAHQGTYQGYVDMLGQVRDAAVQQNNTKIAEEAQQKLAEIQSKNWMQDLFGMAGPSTAAGAAGAIGSPRPLPTGGGQNPVVPQPSPAGAPTPQTKAAAKSQKSSGGGPVVVNGFSFPNQQAANKYKQEAGLP